MLELSLGEFIGSLLGSLSLGVLLTVIALGVLVCICAGILSCTCLGVILVLWSIDCIGGYRFRQKLFRAIKKRIRVPDSEEAPEQK